MGMIRTGLKWIAIAFVGMIVVALALSLILGGGGGGGGGGGAPTATSANSGTSEVTTAATTQTSAPTDTETATSSSSSDIQVRVIYSGDWTGNVGSTATQRSVEGSGDETFDIEVEQSFDVVSAVFQKTDDSDAEMTVQIIENGEVVEEQSTTAGYGTVSVTHSL